MRVSQVSNGTDVEASYDCHRHCEPRAPHGWLAASNPTAGHTTKLEAPTTG